MTPPLLQDNGSWKKKEQERKAIPFLSLFFFFRDVVCAMFSWLISKGRNNNFWFNSALHGGKIVSEHFTSPQKGKCHMKMVKRQAPPETDFNVGIDLWKNLSISTDHKNDWAPSFACSSLVPAVRGNEAEASCLTHTCILETGQRNCSFFLHWVRK